MKQIPLTKGKFAIVDDEDFEYLNRWKWHINTKGYAVRKVYIGSGHKNRVGKNFYIHTLVNKTPDNMQTDHINRNKLDNRKVNLRTVDNQKNHFNMPLFKNNKSGYAGVCWFKRDGNWHAQITLNYKKIHLGYFNNLVDAVAARKDAERKYHAI